MLPVYILLSCILATSLFVVWKLLAKAQTEDEGLLKKKEQEIGELQQQIKELADGKIRLETSGKEMYDRYKSLESDHKALIKERDGLNDKVSKYEATKEQQEKKHQEMSNQLETAKNALDEEKMRIRKEDEMEKEKEKSEWDRMWTDHEQNVISLLTEACKRPALNFDTYDNNNLPEGFHGKVKPDFMVSFLGQYIIFDAKVSKSDNLQVYIKDQVKKTAQKIKGHELIYSSVFLIVPTAAIEQLKSLHFYEEGFSFFVVSPESIEPILASFKKIETYEFAEQMDPQERENIIDLIAQFDFHVSSRNAVDFALMEHGIAMLKKTEKMDPELLKEVAAKKAKIRHLNLNTAEQKQLVSSPEALYEKLNDAINPKAKITADELKQAHASLDEISE